MPPPNCEGGCDTHVVSFLSVGWVRYAIDTTITAATLESIIYPKYNVTKTRLLANDLPEGYTTQERNEAGTVVTSVTVDRGISEAFTTVL